MKQQEIELLHATLKRESDVWAYIAHLYRTCGHNNREFSTEGICITLGDLWRYNVHYDSLEGLITGEMYQRCLRRLRATYGSYWTRRLYMFVTRRAYYWKPGKAAPRIKAAVNLCILARRMEHLGVL